MLKLLLLICLICLTLQAKLKAVPYQRIVLINGRLYAVPIVQQNQAFSGGIAQKSTPLIVSGGVAQKSALVSGGLVQQSAIITSPTVAQKGTAVIAVKGETSKVTPCPDPIPDSIP